jgi:hypothetical protein
MADDDGVMYSVAADYELDVGNLAVFYGRGPPASSAMTEAWGGSIFEVES